ncbi:WD40 repeat domain-containing protein [Actinoplanes sp. DH11]|uniref:WD40 repeat domain-containing protein n=1 Tax=Actinoplanes sp. DH11 TaxID=2857011 RepID=UPI001E2CD93F|nr:WD40 repeat domain-containing protein [Actinoplanes sp. DH11]
MACLTVLEAGGPHAIIVRGPALEIIDLTSGLSAGTVPTGLATIEAVAAADFDGRPVGFCVASGRLHAFDLASGVRLDILFAGPAPEIITAGVLAGHPVLIGATGNELRRWDLATGAEVGGPLAVHRADVRALALTTHAGRPVVISADSTGVIYLSDLASGEEAGDPVVRPAGSVVTLAAAEVDGKLSIITGDGSTVPEPALTDVDAVATAVLDGRPVLVTSGLDESVRTWFLPGGEPAGPPWADETVSITAVAVGSVDGRPTAISGDGDGALRRFDLSTLTPLGDRIEAHASWVRAVATAELHGRTVAVTAADRTIRVWDLATGAPVGEPIDTRYPATVLTTASWNGLTIAVALHGDGRTRAWDLATGELAAGPLDEWSGARAFAQAGGVIYAVTEDHPYDEESGDYDRSEIALRAWDLAEGNAIGTPMPGGGVGGTVTWPPVTVVESGERPIVVSGAGADGRLRAWDLTAGTPLTEPLAGHDGQLTAVAATTGDERPIVVTGGEDGTLRVWDVMAGEAIGEPLTGHAGRISAVAVAGSLLVSASEDGTVRVWDLPGGELRARFR